jgi:hypothetical protein
MKLLYSRTALRLIGLVTVVVALGAPRKWS